MAKTLTIAGSNFLPQYKTNSAKIRELIQNKPNVMNMTIIVKTGQSMPQEGSELVFKDDTRFLFGGFVSQIKPREVGEGQMFIYDVEVSDYSYIFGYKIASKAYSNQTLKAIAEDLLSEYIDSGYGFDTTNIQAGPTIQSITFDHISIRKCFEKLSKLTGYVWYVDYEKNIFFQEVQQESAPEQITDSSDNMESISISCDTSQVRNSVTVIGSENGVQSLSTNTETFEGDGDTRTFLLDDKPSQIVSIKLNGVPQSFSLDVNQSESDYFIYSFSGQYIQVTEGNTTPVGGGTPDEIEVVYYPRIPIIAKRKDLNSIAFFAALDGGDGEYEHTIKDTSISTKQEAIERAQQELSEFANALVDGQFTTRTGLLNASSVFKPGQYLTVNLPTYGISTDTVFLIQEVNISMVEDGDTTEYVYTVRFGGKMVGVQEFLESLASEGEEVDNVDEIKTIKQATDELEMDDGTPSQSITTGNFEYGPSGSPQGKWNKSEWA